MRAASKGGRRNEGRAEVGTRWGPLSIWDHLRPFVFAVGHPPGFWRAKHGIRGVDMANQHMPHI